MKNNQNKILILGGGMFGFAIANHLGKNNTDQKFSIYEKDEKILDSLKNKRENPYFFQGTQLPNNIFFEENLENNIGNYDIIIIAIPTQFVVKFLGGFKDMYKPGVTFVNLSKGIDNQNLSTIGDGLKTTLNTNSYNYSVLSGGMIASELIDEKPLGADIAINNKQIGKTLQQLFQSKNLHIYLSSLSTKSIELLGALKNIIAISIGYHIGQNLSHSSLGYYLCKLLEEQKQLIHILGGEKNITFSDYALGGDIIATCFGNSRNKYFGTLLGKGKTVQESLQILKSENKIAEGYYTLQGVSELIKNKKGFTEIKKIISIIS